MLTKESSDKQILDHVLSGTSIRDFGTMSFLGWVSGKINGLPAYRGATQELLGLLKAPPLGPMPEGEKVRIVRKLLDLEVNI